MSITNLIEKVKSRLRPFYNLILIIFIAIIFFGLGRISALEEQKTPIKVIYPDSNQTASVIGSTNNGISQNLGGGIIGSKNGKKYYFPWCGTVKMIKPENQIKFSSIEEARKAGYLPASNCKGLK